MLNAMRATLGVPGVAGSDDCAPFCCMSVSRSQWPSAWPLHHSAGPSTKKVVERRKGKDEVEYEKYVCLRAQKTPLPGKRPGVPTEPEAQGPLLAGSGPEHGNVTPPGRSVEEKGRGGGRGKEGCGGCEESGPQGVEASSHEGSRTKLNALVDLHIRHTPAQLRRMVELAEEVEVINSSSPGPSSASSSSRKKKKRRKMWRRKV